MVVDSASGRVEVPFSLAVDFEYTFEADKSGNLRKVVEMVLSKLNKHLLGQGQFKNDHTAMVRYVRTSLAATLNALTVAGFDGSQSLACGSRR